METQPIENEIQPIATAGAELLIQANRGEVTDDASAEKMTDLTKFAKTQLKKSEDARKALVKPLNDHVKWINGEFKKAQEPLQEAEKVAKSKIGAYLSEKQRKEREEQERIRREEEERRLQEAARLEDEGDLSGAEELLDSAPTAATAPASSPVRGDMGGTASTMKVAKVRITDMAAAAKARPDLFNLAEQQAIRALKAGESIPGLELYEEETVVIR